MKLLFCPICWDVKKLTRMEVRKCKCGKARGQYLPNGDDVWVSPGALVLGLSNPDLYNASLKRLAGGDAEVYLTCWLFEKWYPKITVINEPELLPGKMIELPPTKEMTR